MLEHVPHGSFARTVSDGSLAGPVPTAFSARTLNRYSDPSISCVALTVVSLASATLSQRSLFAPVLSTMYPVTGDPPSVTGGLHVSTHESRKISVTSGLDGAPGGSAMIHRFTRLNGVIKDGPSSSRE